MQTPSPLSPSLAPANPRLVKISDISAAYLELLEADQEVVVYFNYPDTGLDNVMNLIPLNSEFGLNRITPMFVLGLSPLYHEGKVCVWSPEPGATRVSSRQNAAEFLSFLIKTLAASPALSLKVDEAEGTILFPGESALAAMYQGDAGPQMMTFPEKEERIQLIT